MSIKITWKQFIRQAVSDWFGKEVQTGYTYSYVWMTNQFGHFNLGFLFSYFCYFLAVLIFTVQSASRWLFVIPLVWFLFWCIKEIRDYFKAVREATAKNVFPVVKIDIALDAGTAVLFIGIGLISAYISWYNALGAILSFIVSLIIAIFPAHYWMVRKMYFQQSGLPFQYRLSDFGVKLKSTISDAASDPSQSLVASTLSFINDNNSIWKHMIVFGAYKTGKTSLVVGIGTEKAFTKGVVCYSSYFKFLQLLSDNTANSNGDGYQTQWNWNDSDIMIVDDINPYINNLSLLTPAEFENAFRKISAQNLQLLLQRKTVWALGITNADTDALIDQWHSVFERVLSCSKTNIGKIVLKNP